MNRLLQWTTAVLLALLTGTVSAQPSSSDSREWPLPRNTKLLDELPEIQGVVSWRILARAKEVRVGGKYVAEFSPEVIGLDQQEVSVQGYMMPIVAGERHEHFLLTMRPPHCPFCLAIGPAFIVEVKTKTPIKHTLDPIVVSGRFNVLRDDPQGLFYRMTGAQVAPIK